MPWVERPQFVSNMIHRGGRKTILVNTPKKRKTERRKDREKQKRKK